MDETGLLDEEIVEQDESIFNVEKTYGTTYTIQKMEIRHLIFRQNPQAADMADWINQLNQTAEETAHGIPMVITSNSRNENGEVVFGMNDAAGVFPAWPGTMGTVSYTHLDVYKRQAQAAPQSPGLRPSGTRRRGRRTEDSISPPADGAGSR